MQEVQSCVFFGFGYSDERDKEQKKENRKERNEWCFYSCE